MVEITTKTNTVKCSVHKTKIIQGFYTLPCYFTITNSPMFNKNEKYSMHTDKQTVFCLLLNLAWAKGGEAQALCDWRFVLPLASLSTQSQP